jgi:toxin ParE1/3/4
MTYRVEIADRAIRDIERIRARINVGESRQARLWLDKMERLVLSLDDNPARCPMTPEDEKMRHLLFGHGRNIYRIIFAINETARIVSVVHIRHGSRKAFDSASPD